MNNTAHYEISESRQISTDTCSMDQAERFFQASRSAEAEITSTVHSFSNRNEKQEDTWSTVDLQEPIKIPSVISLPTAPRSINYRQLQLWEGCVDSVDINFFTATITDRTDSSQPKESVEIDLEELSETQRARVKPGAQFIWSIAYEDVGTGRRTISEIRFRRMRKWTKRAQAVANKKADFIRSVLGDK